MLFPSSIWFEILQFLFPVKFFHLIEHASEIASRFPSVVQVLVANPFDLILVVTSQRIDPPVSDILHFVMFSLATTLGHLIIISPASPLGYYNSCVMKVCGSCSTRKAFIKRPKTGRPICQLCFFDVFEEEIHQTITQNNLFRKGDRVAIGTSGGKDSTVIAHVMNKLNRQHAYGLDLFMLSIDEGIHGYRDDSL